MYRQENENGKCVLYLCKQDLSVMAMSFCLSVKVFICVLPKNYAI